MFRDAKSFRECGSRKGDSFLRQIMSEDKYTTIFLRQMEAIVFIFPQIFFQRAGKVSTNSSPFIT